VRRNPISDPPISAMEVTSLAVGGLSIQGPVSQDMKKASRCAEHFSLRTRWQIEEPDSLS